MSDTPETEAEWAQKELSSIYRWIERNHADGFIDSLTYPQNLERVTDNWHDRFDNLERELNEARNNFEKALNLSEGRRQCILRNVTAFQIAMRERDEAREQNAKLRDIAERILLNCEILHQHTVKLHRSELDQLKEGAA